MLNVPPNAKVLVAPPSDTEPAVTELLWLNSVPDNVRPVPAV